MFRVKTAILFGNSAAGQLQIRAVNRRKSKRCWVDGHFVENDLPHYRIDDDPSVTFPAPVLTPETRNNDGSSSSLLENELGDSNCESFKDYQFGTPLDGYDCETNLWT
jgi:hypothetical protein